MNTAKLKATRMLDLFGHAIGGLICVFLLVLLMIVGYKLLVWVWSW